MKNLFSQSWCKKFRDDEISSSKPFIGYAPNRLIWPAELVPCALEGPSRRAHAYHVKRLAEAMRQSKAWVGSPPVILKSGTLHDGSHRLRAIQYLANKGVCIDVPDCVILENV